LTGMLVSEILLVVVSGVVIAAALETVYGQP
jgi:hypothetical protein